MGTRKLFSRHRRADAHMNSLHKTYIKRWMWAVTLKPDKAPVWREEMGITSHLSLRSYWEMLGYCESIFFKGVVCGWSTAFQWKVTHARVYAQVKWTWWIFLENNKKRTQNGGKYGRGGRSSRSREGNG